MKQALRIIAALLILALIAWGIHGGLSLLRARSIVRDGDTIAVADTGGALQIDLVTGQSYAHVTYRLAPFAVVPVPQIAVWLEDSEGQFLRTLYVTPKVRTIQRPAALPVWEHRATDGADAVTCATPLSDSQITADAVDADAVVLVEVNLSCDYNAYYRHGLDAEDPGYNTDYAGQPSLIYAGIISPGERIQLMPIGHGAPDGGDGEINPDLRHMTTAMDILEDVTAEAQ